MLASTATSVGSATQAAHLEASLAAHRRAASALRRCQRLLPLVWVSTLRGSMAIASQLLPSADAQLGQLASTARTAPPAALPSQAVSGRGPAAAAGAGGKRQLTGAQRRGLRANLGKAAGAAMEAAASAADALDASMQCCGCRRCAVGLRLCARCGEARYCRSVSQAVRQGRCRLDVVPCWGDDGALLGART